MVSTIDLPFEIWHPILRDVYDNISTFQHLDDPRFVLSKLHRRLLLHRNLSLVSKHLHELSSALFLEELCLNEPAALLAVSRLVSSDRNVARVIRKLWFNFHAYRCGVSSPRRPREMKNIGTEEIPPDSDPVAQAEVRHRNSLYLRHHLAWSSYSPSMTNQPRHWHGWLGFARTILSHCKAVKYVSIDATADYSQHEAQRDARRYQSLFGSPDLNCDSLIAGLLEASNLRVLCLKDPSPLDSFGTALGKWPRLRQVEIEVSRAFPEAKRLSDAIFCPPASLRHFTLMNRSIYTSPLPTTSDLSRCKSLSKLELGVLDLSDLATLLSAQFLISNYQHSLRHLTLQIQRGARDITALLKQGELHFPVLESLEVLGGTCNASLFTVIQAEALIHLALRSIDVDGRGSVRIAVDPSASAESKWTSRTASLATDSEEYWEAFFSQPTLANLKSFHIDVMNPSLVHVIQSVCSERGIDYEDAHTTRHLGA